MLSSVYSEQEVEDRLRNALSGKGKNSDDFVRMCGMDTFEEQSYYIYDIRLV